MHIIKELQAVYQMARHGRDAILTQGTTEYYEDSLQRSVLALSFISSISTVPLDFGFNLISEIDRNILILLKCLM